MDAKTLHYPTLSNICVKQPPYEGPPHAYTIQLSTRMPRQPPSKQKDIHLPLLLTINNPTPPHHSNAAHQHLHGHTNQRTTPSMPPTLITLHAYSAQAHFRVAGVMSQSITPALHLPIDWANLSSINKKSPPRACT